jgi:hypothetical protein
MWVKIKTGSSLNYVKGSNRNFFPDAVAMSAKSLNVPVVAAVVGSYDAAD